jgi:dienelactone hydrolase
MRTDVEFTSAGVTLRGHFYRPDGVGEARPTVVMCHGFGGIMEIVVDPYAAFFTEHGYCALTFDYRYNGSSDGEPRGDIDPSVHHDDIRAAITWVLKQPGVDTERVILWGTSYGGAHAMFMGALESRVHGVVSMVPGTGTRGYVEVLGRDAWDALLRVVTDDFVKAEAAGEDALVPIAAQTGRCWFPQPGTYEWFEKNAFKHPTFLNGALTSSWRRGIEYDPTLFIDLISPRPFLMLVAEDDLLASPRLARRAFDKASEPKQFASFPGGHFDLYEHGLSKASAMTTTLEWLTRHFPVG